VGRCRSTSQAGILFGDAIGGEQRVPDASSKCAFFCRRAVSWNYFAARFSCGSTSGVTTPTRVSALALFLQYIYVLRNCVRSLVHHFFAYGDGLTFGVSLWIASNTTPNSLYICCGLSPPPGIGWSAAVILSRISFHGAFFQQQPSFRASFRTTSWPKTQISGKRQSI
jgi:hypothetical protein